MSHEALSPNSHKAKHGPTSTLSRGLTLIKTKDIIVELFASKHKNDEQSITKKQARETMEQHMFTFLNQRYGLKQLIVDWAQALIAAVKHFSPTD
jgi:hypothetical protein